MSFIAGVDIGGISVKIGILDEQGRVLAKSGFATPGGDAEVMARRIAREIRALPLPAEAIGVGTAGRVYLDTGRVTASNLGWDDQPLRDLLSAHSGLPVFVDNDAQAALLHEWQAGACRGLRDVIYLTFGTGIGGAMLLAGRPYRGNAHQGGEIGHMITHAEGDPCPCGQRGCYERYASVGALMRKLSAESVPAFMARVADGDQDAQGIFQAYLHEVVIGLATLERVFAPQAFVIGGGLSNAGALFLDALTAAHDDQMAHVANRQRPSIILAEARNDAGILGGAAIARYYMHMPSE